MKMTEGWMKRDGARASGGKGQGAYAALELGL